MDCPFDQVRSAVLAVFLPSLLPTSSLLTAGGRKEEREKAFVLHKHCSLVCYGHWLSTWLSATKEVNTISVAIPIHFGKSFKIENVIKNYI